MKDKEKQLEEMKDIVHNLWDKLNQDAITTNDIIDALYEQGYRKIPEDSVVLTQGEYSDILNDEIQIIERDVAEFWANGSFDEVVKELYNLGYRKLDDHAIMVLRKAKGIENRIRKETAEKIYNFVERYIMDDYEVELMVKEWFKEEFGCEIKE